MKVRMGFVSNSSSSSFVVLGYEIKFEELKDKKINEESIFFEFDCGEYYIGEFTQKMYDIVKKNPKMKLDLNLYCDKTGKRNKNGLFNRNNLPEEFNCFLLEGDYGMDDEYFEEISECKDYEN